MAQEVVGPGRGAATAKRLANVASQDAGEKMRLRLPSNDGGNEGESLVTGICLQVPHPRHPTCGVSQQLRRIRACLWSAR